MAGKPQLYDVALVALAVQAALSLPSREATRAAIVNPQTLAEAVTAEAMLKFRNAYAAGECSRFGTRAAHTVIGNMAALIAMFRWAKTMGMFGEVPELPRYRPPAKKRDAKGRPLSEEEVQRFIAAVPRVVGESAAGPWVDLINGILESSLRL